MLSGIVIWCNLIVDNVVDVVVKRWNTGVVPVRTLLLVTIN